MDKKFESFRSKVSTSDILAIHDPESMQLDEENSQFDDRKSVKREIEKSVSTTPTRHGGRVTRSRTPQCKKVTDNAPKVPNTPTDKTAAPKRSAKNKAKQINKQVYFSCGSQRFRFEYCKLEVGLASRRPAR